jgi:hypothetical protein
MYQYRFERVELSKWGYEQRVKADYHQIIHDHAREGWRLVQIFAPPILGNGNASYFDLIFEREVGKDWDG